MSIEDLLRLHDENRCARQSLALLHTAVSSLPCPPEGHAFLGLLRESARYFETELPRHILEEETRVFPHYAGMDGAGELVALREEHRQLHDMAAEFARWVRHFAEAPTDEAWRMVREHGNAIEMATRRHMDHEDAILRRLTQAECHDSFGQSQ
ncbi:MAG: hemerythrin domain-containing protein [Candidatus Sericytochromatia bacterium]